MTRVHHAARHNRTAIGAMGKGLYGAGISSLLRAVTGVTCSPTEVVLLLAQSRHRMVEFRCPLLGVKRTSAGLNEMSANDPKQTYELAPRTHVRPTSGVLV